MAAVDLQSTVSMWICLLLSVIFIGIRLSLRRWRGQEFLRGDFWCMSAAALIVARLIGNHLLVIYGSTRTISPGLRLRLSYPDMADEAATVVTGSKLALATRALLTCILWCLKMAVLDLLARLIAKMPYERKLLYFAWAALGATFVASLVTVFVGCAPFEKHWQIYPDPGDCVVGDVWLFTYETSNIITDLLLMSVPFYLILSIKIPLMQHLRLLFLFSVGVFLVAISIIRIIQGKNSRVQRGHTLWASLEVFFAVVVAVTPTIYALIRNRREDSTWNRSQATFDMDEGHLRRKGSAVRADKWTELEDATNLVEPAMLRRDSSRISSVEEISPMKNKAMWPR